MQPLNNPLFTNFCSNNNDYYCINNLYHNYKDGKSTINGYLEDYCFVIDAFIALYEVTIDEKWLQNAKHLTDYCFDSFFDEKTSFFTFTSKIDVPLITTHFETEDNVIPASNSVMANNLFKLGVYFHNPHYDTICREMLKQIIPNIDYPSGYSNWLNVFMNYSEQNKELGICGENALKYISKINQKFLPNIVVAATKQPTSLPFFKDRFVENQLLFYICQNQSCLLPMTKFETVLEILTV